MMVDDLKSLADRLRNNQPLPPGKFFGFIGDLEDDLDETMV